MRAPVIVSLIVSLPIALVGMLLVGGYLGLFLVLFALLMAVGLFYLMAPPLVREAWKAEETGGVLLLLHGDDHRVHPVATQYFKGSNLLRPFNRRFRGIAFKPDPDSTAPIIGQKSKVALAYVNYPATISPDHVLIAYDLKRYGLNNLAQALEYNRFAEKLEDLEAYAERVRNVVKALENAGSPDEVSDEVWEELGKLGLEKPVPDDLEAFYIMREGLKNYLEDLEDTIRAVKAHGLKNKLVLRIAGRFYTIKDVLGFLGIKTRLSDLASIVESARLEERLRLRDRWKDVGLYGIIIFGFIALIVVVALVTGNHGSVPNVGKAVTGVGQHIVNTSVVSKP